MNEAVDLAKACIRYHGALISCCNDPNRMTSFCTADGETLDDLYRDWLNKAKEILIKDAT